MQQWFVAHTQPRAEVTALGHLLRQGFSAYLPRYLKRRSHARRNDIVAAPLFPRYLFVGFDAAVARWRAIRSTVGIADLVCQGDRPLPVSDSILAGIKAREGDDGMIILGRGVEWRQGDRVKITTGALAEQIGLFDRVADELRVIILMNLLGRDLRVTVARDHISAAA